MELPKAEVKPLVNSFGWKKAWHSEGTGEEMENGGETRLEIQLKDDSWRTMLLKSLVFILRKMATI